MSNLNWVKKFENCERDGLDFLQMIHITHWWWWKFKIKRIAKVAKWEIVEIVKKYQLCLSIVLNLGWICTGGLYQSCSPWSVLGCGAKNWKSLVWKTWNPGAQSSDQNVNGKNGHYFMWSPIELGSDLICFSLIPKVVISV